MRMFLHLVYWVQTCVYFLCLQYVKSNKKSIIFEELKCSWTFCGHFNEHSGNGLRQVTIICLLTTNGLYFLSVYRLSIWSLYWVIIITVGTSRLSSFYISYSYRSILALLLLRKSIIKDSGKHYTMA